MKAPAVNSGSESGSECNHTGMSGRGCPIELSLRCTTHLAVKGWSEEHLLKKNVRVSSHLNQSLRTVCITLCFPPLGHDQ